MFFRVLFCLLFLRLSLLLPQELVKETPEGHVDYADLRKCEETIKDLAAQINEAKRLFENCQVSAEIDYDHFAHQVLSFETQKLWAIQSKLSFDYTEDLRTSRNGALKQPRVSFLKGSCCIANRSLLSAYFW